MNILVNLFIKKIQFLTAKRSPIAGIVWYTHFGQFWLSLSIQHFCSFQVIIAIAIFAFCHTCQFAHYCVNYLNMQILSRTSSYIGFKPPSCWNRYYWFFFWQTFETFKSYSNMRNIIAICYINYMAICKRNYG